MTNRFNSKNTKILFCVYLCIGLLICNTNIFATRLSLDSQTIALNKFLAGSKAEQLPIKQVQLAAPKKGLFNNCKCQKSQDSDSEQIIAEYTEQEVIHAQQKTTKDSPLGKEIEAAIKKKGIVKMAYGAVCEGRIDIIDYIIENYSQNLKIHKLLAWAKHYSRDVRDLTGCALSSAACNQQLDLMEYILDNYGEKLEEKEEWDRWLIFARAAEQGKLNIVKSMLDKYSQEDTGIEISVTVAFDFAIRGGQINLIEYLIKNCHSYVSSYTDERYTEKEHLITHILQDAVLCDRLDVVKYILKNYISPRDAWERLIEAAEHGYLDIVKYIIEETYLEDTDAGTWSASIALKQAAEYGHLDIVKYILDNYAKTAKAIKKLSIKEALQYAAFKGQIDVIRYILDSYDKVANSRTELGIDWALGSAAPYCATSSAHYFNVAKYLFDRYGKGISLEELNSVFIDAARHGNLDIIKCVLDRYGKDANLEVNLALKAAATGHHYSMRDDCASVTKYLLGIYGEDTKSRME